MLSRGLVMEQMIIFASLLVCRNCWRVLMPICVEKGVTTSATILHPTIAALSSRKHPPRNTAVNGPAPYNYSACWKMFFPTASPHWQRAHQLATRTRPVADGAILTYGTPDTYPDILNQWNSPPPPR